MPKRLLRKLSEHTCKNCGKVVFKKVASGFPQTANKQIAWISTYLKIRKILILNSKNHFSTAFRLHSSNNK